MSTDNEPLLPILAVSGIGEEEGEREDVEDEEEEGEEGEGEEEENGEEERRGE